VLDRFCRAIAALAVAPWLAMSPAMPPQHAHEADIDHPHAIVHRHAEAHSLAARHDEGLEASADEERVVWLNDVGLSQPVYHVTIFWTLTFRLFAAIDDSPAWVAIESHDESPSHGPPRRCLSLRAPPLIAA
jgi:hypothetical protein